MSKADLTPAQWLRSLNLSRAKGVYQHCAHNHLHRYLAEFDFRYNNRKALGVEDSQRADTLLKGFAGKRLTYQTTAI